MTHAVDLVSPRLFVAVCEQGSLARRDRQWHERQGLRAGQRAGIARPGVQHHHGHDGHRGQADLFRRPGGAAGPGQGQEDPTGVGSHGAGWGRR
jgi:hypothetical protein